MIYTALTKKAMRIAFDAHKEQKDKAGLPYVFHPFHLAEQMVDENTTCAALLHDVIEDTPITLEALREEGFPEEVLDAIRMLAHEENVDYMDYVRRIRENSIARAVKIADLHHNRALSRMDVIDEASLLRMEKYKQALLILE